MLNQVTSIVMIALLIIEFKPPSNPPPKDTHGQGTRYRVERVQQ